jgi:signal transduction histidine kinase
MDLNRAVEGAFSLVIAQARMTHVQVDKELAADLPHIQGNLNQIQQIIINLANNALDAIGDSAGQIIVKTEILKDGPLAWVCLSVTDTGPGIPPQVLPRIFEPFFTTKPVGKGTGLGLSLVHEIIKKHSGTTDVESRPGRTVFRIKFPAHQAQAPRAVEPVVSQ